MKKLFLIAWKDLTLAFRDKAGLILMLAAPFALTIGMGAITGGFSSGSSGIQEIPVVIVNQDDGVLGQTLVDVFQSQELATLVQPSILEDVADARRMVDENESTCAIIIPAGYSESIIPTGESQVEQGLQIEFYANPTSPVSASVVKTILTEFTTRVDRGRVSTEVIIRGLLQSGRLEIQDAAVMGAALGVSQAEEQATSISVKTVTASGEAVEFNMLALLAPNMALMFLMYATSNGGRTLLVERRQGTLPRLLISPTTGTQVLGGKVIGIFLTGVAQMFILILGTTLLFQLQWGDPFGVLVLVLAAVWGATGWGMLITALVKTPGQVAAIGSAIMLTFGILGGSFINRDSMAEWFRYVSMITPNAWGGDGFTTLALGGGLVDILTPVAALLIMGTILFAVSVMLFSRRGIMKN